MHSHLPFYFLPSLQTKCCSHFSHFPLPNLKVMDSTFCILPSSFFSFCCITYLTIPCSAKRKEGSHPARLQRGKTPGCFCLLNKYPFTPTATAAAKSLQSCPTLCDPIDGSSPGSPVPGILQARTLECVAISFSHAWKWKGKVKSLSRVRLLATPWTAAYQAPPSTGFSRQEYWSGVPLPSLLLIGMADKMDMVGGGRWCT